MGRTTDRRRMDDGPTSATVAIYDLKPGQQKYVQRPPVQHDVRPQLLLSIELNRRHAAGVVNCCTECDGQNLLLTIIVDCVDNTCGMTPKSNKRRVGASFRRGDVFVQIIWLKRCIVLEYWIKMTEQSTGNNNNNN